MSPTTPSRRSTPRTPTRSRPGTQPRQLFGRIVILPEPYDYGEADKEPPPGQNPTRGVLLTMLATTLDEPESATRVGDDVPTDRYVLFAQSGELGVRANLLDEQAAEILAKTKEDPRVTLKCYCEGINGNLILKSCVRH